MHLARKAFSGMLETPLAEDFFYDVFASVATLPNKHVTIPT
jgi:hypothetical protein